MKASSRNGWLLFAAVPLMIGLWVVDSQMAYGAGLHQIVQLGIVALAFGWVAVCVHTSPSAPDTSRLAQNYPIREHHVFSAPPPEPGFLLEMEEPVAVPEDMWLDLASADKGRYN